MRKVFGFLAMAPVSGFIAAAILIAVTWFLSGLLPFLAGTVMWIIIGVIAFLYLLARCRLAMASAQTQSGNAGRDGA